jgi:hypothetical protein
MKTKIKIIEITGHLTLPTLLLAILFIDYPIWLKIMTAVSATINIFAAGAILGGTK